MDRTILLTDKWYYSDGLKKSFSPLFNVFCAKAEFPVRKNIPFTLTKKVICPKQVNDTVTVFFSGDFNGIKVYAAGKELTASINEDGVKVYDITPALKTGKTVITATFENGTVEGFFLSVKRNLMNN